MSDREIMKFHTAKLIDSETVRKMEDELEDIAFKKYINTAKEKYIDIEKALINDQPERYLRQVIRRKIKTICCSDLDTSYDKIGMQYGFILNKAGIQSEYRYKEIRSIC